MASARYERLPTAPNSYSNDSDEEPPETGGQRSDIRELHRMLHADPRFNPPPPAAWKRVALVLGVLFLFWLGFTMRRALLTPLYPPEVIHADRYSKEFKYRPAASPIITEKLKNGKTRLRGAVPTARQKGL